jgi:hypothetical protein
MTDSSVIPICHSPIIHYFKNYIANLIGQKKSISNLIGQKKSDSSFRWLIRSIHLPITHHSLLEKLAFLTSLARKKASQIWLVKKKWLIFCMTHRTDDSSHKWLTYVFSTTYLSKLTGEVSSDRLDENRKNELECLFHLLLYFINDSNRYYSKSSNR